VQYSIINRNATVSDFRLDAEAYLPTKVKQMITEAFDLRKESKHLLECAKRAVEAATEQNEDAAMRFLEEHVMSGRAIINTSTMRRVCKKLH
jgi:hypothetical protein